MYGCCEVLVPLVQYPSLTHTHTHTRIRLAGVSKAKASDALEASNFLQAMHGGYNHTILDNVSRLLQQQQQQQQQQQSHTYILPLPVKIYSLFSFYLCFLLYFYFLFVWDFNVFECLRLQAFQINMLRSSERAKLCTALLAYMNAQMTYFHQVRVLMFEK